MTKGDNWGTPKWLFEQQNRIFNFTIDAAADESNHLLPRWYGNGGEREDALEAPWDPTEVYWCNPPYSRGMQGMFTERALEVARAGGFVVMLLPADTSTQLFHYLRKSTPVMIELLKGRIRFEGAPSAARFGSMLVYFGL